jgi:NADH-quinone oxidoreductase subunit C
MTGVHQWREAILQAREDGFTYFDFLTAIDRDNSQIEVMIRVTNPEYQESRTLTTRLSGDQLTLDSVTDIYPGADWHERETAEMFGINFVGNDCMPLLRHQLLGAPPLRKSVILSTRVVTDWPGAAEPEIKSDGRKIGNPSRRRQRPPGVPENWLKS